ncbi:MAG: hypothetical protein ABI670_22265 [Chloroflexota bacterium]
MANYITANFIPLKLMLNRPEDWPVFRANNILWTPTIAFMDRNAKIHYQSPGFMPPWEFLSMLRIGKAHTLMAWNKSREAGVELLAAAEQKNSFAPEALYWLGVASFFEKRGTVGMFTAWDRLTEEYPGTPWAMRVYPH